MTKGHRTKEELRLREIKIKFLEKYPDLTVTAQYKYRKLNPLKNLYRIAAARAKKRGLEFNIEHTDLSLPKFCPLLGIELDQESPDLGVHFSIDRIDNSKGYIKGNVMVISHRANRLKSNATLEELQLLVTNLARYQGGPSL